MEQVSSQDMGRNLNPACNHRACLEKTIEMPGHALAHAFAIIAGGAVPLACGYPCRRTQRESEQATFAQIDDAARGREASQSGSNERLGRRLASH
jgi:hypothetical protein